MTIKAVTFDLWYTLIWDKEELEEYRKLRRLINFHRFAKKYNATLEDGAGTFGFNEVRLALERVSLKTKKLYEEGYDVHPSDRGRMLFELLKIKVPKDEITEVYERAGRILSDSGYLKKHPNVNPEAAPTMKALKELYPHLKIGLISNAARSARTYSRTLKALRIGNYFDHLTISCEVGYLKPKKEIFASALRALKVKPEECLHVGDLFRADVVGATGYGMNAALYTGLWKKYSETKDPLPIHDHLPRGYQAPKGLLVREIGNLKDCVKIAKEISNLRQAC